MERANLRRLCLMALAAVLAACSCARHPQSTTGASAEVGPDEIAVKIAAVGFDDMTQAHYVMLTSADRQHQLPILIGDGEADAILRALHGIKAERPMTLDLMKSIIETNGDQVDCISISDIRDDVYYATIYMNGGKTRVDSRPSDAIALAAGTGAPIFVASRLFEEKPQPGLGGKYEPRTVTAIGITVEQLTPVLAEYFHTSKGVLVADVDPVAAKNGVERGDIILQIGARAIADPSEFARLANDGSGTVVLRVSHDGAEHSVSFER
jgi:bifunctional DNase/RNase